jgi:hypothetical protein
MINMFQNLAGFQRNLQLHVYQVDNKDFSTCIEIRNERNPNDSKQYQLSETELIDLHKLLSSILQSDK